MSPHTQDFYTWMDAIYTRFQANSPSLEGTQVWGIVAKNHNLYTLVLRHPNEVNDTVAEISERVSQITPSLIYSSDTVHTTVVDTIPNGERDGSLEGSLNTLWWAFFPDLTIDFSVPLSNRDSIILLGRPSESFIWLSDALHGSISRANPTSWARLKKPWWAHMTAGRYLSTAPSEVGTEVEKLLREYPALGTVRPVSLEVWSCEIWPNGFTKNILADMPIKAKI